MFVCLNVDVYISKDAQRPEKGLEHFQAGVQGNCEPPDMGAWILTPVPCKNRVLSTTRAIFPAPRFYLCIVFAAWNKFSPQFSLLSTVLVVCDDKGLCVFPLCYVWRKAASGY